jgi:hypothetical protein
VPSHWTSLGRLRHLRLFGFVVPGWQPAGRPGLGLQSFVGPVIYRVDDGRAPESAVRVLAFRPPWSPPCADDLSPYERKRQAYWHNHARNDALAAVARAWRGGDEEALWEQGLLLGQKPAGLWEAGPPSVTVLVESPAHGRELLGRLPGWRLEALLPKVMPATGPGWARPLDGVVLTARAAACWARLPTDVLIRADGGGWPLGMLALAPHAGGEALLVDVLDDADGPAAAATRRRLADYAARGWHVELPGGGPQTV